MAAPFSIREYAAGMRGSAAGRGLLGVEELPPIEVRRFRWWADELAAAPRRSPGKAKAPKKRSISDLFAAAPPVAAAAGGGNEEEVEVDEALCAIRRRAKAKKRKRRLEEAAAERMGGRREGNIAGFARKEALDKPKMPDELQTPQTSKKSEGEPYLRAEKEIIPDIKGRKQGKVSNLKKRKSDKLKCSQSRKDIKVGKPRDLTKKLPLHSILKKYTKCTSVKMVKEKHGNSKGTEVIELCRKSVKRVKFSEADDILGSKKQSSKLPQLESLCELFSDVLASSSSSTEMSSEGDKSIAAESSSSHRPEKAFTKTKEANQKTDHEDSPELGHTDLSSSLIDLNQALPESTDLSYMYISNSEVPNPEHTLDEIFNSDVQVLDDGRENQKQLSFDSHRLECESHTVVLERNRNSRSACRLMHDDAIEVSDTEIVALPLNLRNKVTKRHPDFCSSSVRDTRMKGKPPCAVQDSAQMHQSWCSTNLNHSGSQLSTGGVVPSCVCREVPSCVCRECNLPCSEKPNFRSDMNVQHEFRPSSGQIVRLMGKNLTVCTTRGECLAEAATKHTDPSANDHVTTKLYLELPRQGQPFLSLQAQSFPNASANSTSTSQASFGYRPPHNFSHPFPTANVFSRDRSPYEDMFRDLSNPQPHQSAPLGRPPLPNRESSSFHQNSQLAPWCYYSDPFTRTGPHSAPVLPTVRPHVTPSSVHHANLPQPYALYPSTSLVRPHDRVSFTLSHPDRIIQQVSDSRRDAALASRNTGNGMARAAPDNSTTSCSNQYVQRSGPVKLIAGAKHILKPSENTGDDSSVPVYSCVSFGSRSGNVSVSQNKGAELYKF